MRHLGVGLASMVVVFGVQPSVAQDDVDEIATSISPPSYLLFYDEGAKRIDEEAREYLEEAIAEIVHCKTPPREVTVTGYADRVGSDQANDELALQRALIVWRELVAAGVPGEIISVRSKGEKEPLVPTADGVHEPQNAFVKIEVHWTSFDYRCTN